ncbi:MAG: glutathione S-transferase family protein [Xanthobacteraceae bacterium]
MGLLVDGVWHEQWYDTAANQGQFVRSRTSYRNWVTADGGPGPSGEGGFKAERDRYQLYVALACPWAHRTLILRKLKKLEGTISVSVVSPLMGSDGWIFDRRDGSTGDEVNGASKLADIYLLANPRFSGLVTVPMLWDKKLRTIVNNESSEIVRMFNAAFAAFTAVETDFYPPALRPEIDRINDLVYANVNNGVYRAGFATSQQAYEEAFRALFDTLDQLETILAGQRYLVGNVLTEADWRLFTTLIRFDAVYYGHFKCNWRRIIDYPNLSNYLRDLYQMPGIAETVNMDHIKRHYYGSHRPINPTGIVPLGPELDFSAPHNRKQMSVISNQMKN